MGKPRLHVSPSSRRQRRPSVHVARTFAWRPWTSSTTLASAWGSFCPTTAEVICYLRCTFIVIRSSPRLLLLALALSCFSILAIGLALNSTLTSANTSTASVPLALKYTLSILALGILAIVVRRGLVNVQEKGGKRIKTKV